VKRWIPASALLLAALWALHGLRVSPPDTASAFDTLAFGRLPALVNGRLQPLDTVGRNSLRVLSGKQSVALDAGRSLDAAAWLLEVLARPSVADTRPCFKIDHPELRSLLKLKPEGPLYVAFGEFAGQLDELERQAQRAGSIPAASRSAFEKALLKLHAGTTLYRRLKNSLHPEETTDMAALVADYQAALGPGLAAWKLRQDGKEPPSADLERIGRLVQSFDFMASVAHPLVIPPAHPETRRDDWSSLGTALLEALQTGTLRPPVNAYATMVTAFALDRPEDFNRAVETLRRSLEPSFRSELARARREHLYNHWQPFLKSTALYVLVFLLACCSWFGWFTLLNRTGYGLLGVAFALHTAGIAFRMILEGRPPVTNLYSSAVFVGWGAVLLGILLERLHRDSLGLAMAAALGFLTQIVAHNLSLDGDTMQVLRAVLDTNFWLATHVITITLGYSAAFVAGFLAALHVLRAFFTRSLDAAAAQRLRRNVYGVICFATLFSFIGTVLGGIWADQSWGRFWGWDPKENGALMIVLWYAAILHALEGDWIAERGLMNMALFGNIVTAFSWFGVNMLGVGLHSYGFMDQAFLWLMAFVASQLLLIGIGLLPRSATPSRSRPR